MMALQLKGNGTATYYQSAEFCRNYSSPPVSYGDSSHYFARLPGKKPSRITPTECQQSLCAKMEKKCKLISYICRWQKKGNVDIAFVQSASSSSGHLEVCSLGLYGHSSGLLCCRRAQCNLKQCDAMFLSFTKSSGLLSGQEGAEFALLSLICTADDGMRLLHSKGFFVAPACC